MMMTEPRLLQNIRSQPGSLARVMRYQLGEGRQALLEAAAAMRRAPRVVLTGMGSSLFGAIPARYLLASRGMACDVVETAELLHYLHGECREAAVLVISRSGESVEASSVLGELHRVAQTVIGVTNEPGSSLAMRTRPGILVNSCADEMVAVQTYTATVLVLLTLAHLAVEDPEPEWRGEFEAAIAALGEAIAKYESESESWRDFLEGAPTIHLLARGPSLASAWEGALLFNEVAKTSSTAMGAGDFRHGPVEIVDHEFRGIVFAPEGVTRSLNLALAGDLASFGGRVRVIGPEDGGAADGLFWPTVGVPESLAPLVDIVPVQFAALRLAQWRGIVPGRFRYVPQVTLSESAFRRPAQEKAGAAAPVRADGGAGLT